MKKVKTQNKFVIILSVLLGAVFAFSIGITFAANMQFVYSSKPKSTEAYLSNQQYQLINITTESPINYSVGIHSSEIALQYSYGYNFDVRIKYSLDWLGDDEYNQLSTYNVELLFSNRDNVIVDENYIYFINYKTEEITQNGQSVNIKSPSGISAGSGKLSIITGVEIIETNNDEYIGKSLAINIEEVKIYKEVNNYSDAHTLYSDAYTEQEVMVDDQPETIRVYSEAAKAWLRYKNSSDYTKAYVMMYNYRYTNAVGVSYPGHDSAYKQVDGSDEGTWLGGNRAYAGVGIYIITGSTPVTLVATVVGTWRNASSTATSSQYDNNILFNYNSDWTLNNDGKITYNHVIPANTACYIKMVDSIEITSMGIIKYNDKDSYKMVVRNVSINNNNLTFTYDTFDNVAKIKSGELGVVSISENETRTNYSQKDVTILNAGEYSNNLYTYKLSANSQSFANSTMMLVNNTNVEKQVKLNYSLNYFIANGSPELTYKVTVGEGDESYEVEQKATSFNDNAYYRYHGIDNDGTIDKNDDFTEPLKNTFVIAPNSSVIVPAYYTVSADFQDNVEDVMGFTTAHYDIWVVMFASLAESTDLVTGKDLAIELDMSGAKGAVKVKNNTNKIVNSIDLNINLYARKFEIADSASNTKPDNWEVVFWKYYYIDNSSEEFVQNELVDVDFKPKVFYLGTWSDYYIGKTNNSDLTFVGNEVSGLSLKPNESVVVYTFTKDNDAQFYVNGEANATTTTPDGITLVKDGVNQNYIVNYSEENSYFVRFNGTMPENANLGVDVIIEDDGLNYFITVVRPGQIIKVVSDTTIVSSLPCEDVFISGKNGSLSGWVTESEDLSNVLTAFENYFN